LTHTVEQCTEKNIMIWAISGHCWAL